MATSEWKGHQKKVGFPVTYHEYVFMDWKGGADHLVMQAVDRGSFWNLQTCPTGKFLWSEPPGISGAQLHLVINTPPKVELSSTSIFMPRI